MFCIDLADNPGLWELLSGEMGRKVCWIEWSTRTYILLVVWSTQPVFAQLDPFNSLAVQRCQSLVSWKKICVNVKRAFLSGIETKNLDPSTDELRAFGFDEKLVAGTIFGRIECKGALCTWMTSFMGLSQKALKKTAPGLGNSISKGHVWKGFFRTGWTEDVQSAKTFGCFLWGCFAAENGLQSLQQLLWRWGLDHEIKSKLSTYEDSGFSHFHRFSIIERHT